MPGIIPPGSPPLFKNGRLNDPSSRKKQAPKRSAPLDAKTQKLLDATLDPLNGLTKGDLRRDPKTGFETTRKQRVTQIQQILRNHGYRIKVDGIAGPETNSALADFHGSKPNAKAWNGGHTNTGAALPVDANKTGSFAVRDGKGNETVIDPTTGGGTDPSGSGMTMAQLNKLIGKGGGRIDPSAYRVNPGKYAKSQVDTQYGPQIADANQKIRDASHQADVNLADLSKWFGDAESIAKTGAGQAKKDDLAALHDHTAASQAILAAFGGNAGSGGQSIDNTAQNGANLLSSEMSNHSAFNDMLKGLISTQGADAQKSQSNMDQHNIGDMKNALTALIAAKASALVGDTAQARQQNLANLLSITQSNNQTDASNLNRLITMATLPSQLAGAQLKTAQQAATLTKTQKAGVPKNFFVNASANDLNNAKAAIIAAVKGKKMTPQQAAQAAIAAQPWKINTPGVARRVVLPALTLAGYTGITPGMLGING